MSSDEWVEIFAPGPVDEVKANLAKWRNASSARRQIADTDLRLDLIRTTEGDRLRVMLRHGAEDAGAPV
ncbi:MAG: hypothetical protein U0R68_06005 [Candidatus Nanopelagicales bacterium]